MQLRLEIAMKNIIKYSYILHIWTEVHNMSNQNDEDVSNYGWEETVTYYLHTVSLLIILADDTDEANGDVASMKLMSMSTINGKTWR